MERSPVNLRFDVATGTLAIETGGPNISIEELGPLAVVSRTDDDDEERMALFISPGEVDVLLKMVGYILDKVKITEGSRAALEAVKPRLESLRDG
jgi:hypothetical protein